MPPKIAILIPNLAGGGAERVAINLANGFARREYEVHIILLSATGEFLLDLRPEIRVVDLRVKRLRSTLVPLMRYLRESSPDVLLACMWPLTVIAPLVRTVARVRTRVVVAEHTTWSRDPIASTPWGRWKVGATMHHAFPFANGIVAVSQGAADDLARFSSLDRSTITVVHNPVVGEATLSPGLLPLAPPEWSIGPHRKVLAVGALKPIKDCATLVSGFARLCRQVDSRLLILGEGVCRPALEAQVRQLGIESKVFMPGFIHDPSPYYQLADLHVLSSSGEGFGNVIVEALAAGTPVVSTDCQSGPREILGDGKFGRLVPVGDAEALAVAMAESLSSSHDSAALKSRAQDFSIDRAVDQYLRLLFPDDATRSSK